MSVDLAQHAQAADGYLLAGHRYATFLTVAGAGYSAWNELALTRWNPDLIEGGGGLLLYFRDVASGQFWSFGQSPVEGQESRFYGGIAEFRQQHNGIEALIEIGLAPDADLELRRITLRNLSDRPRRIELTSYAEVVLNHWAADAAHPAFSKLFIQTEWVAESQALLARRRPRTPEEPSCWLVHALMDQIPTPALPFAKGEGVQYETDRARFVGRGFSQAAPQALVTTEPLSGTVGNVLDPVVSLRRTVELVAGGAAQVTFLLGAASERETALALATRYQQVAEIDAAFAAAASREVDGSAPPASPPSRIPLASPPPFAKRGQEGFTEQEESALQFWNSYGGFSAAGDEYVIRLKPDAEGRLKLPPQPWVNIIANPQFGFIASETGAGSTWSQNSRENRLTPWFNDPVLDPHGEALYLRDEADGTFWSVLPGPISQPIPYEVRHGFGYSRYRQRSQGLEQEVWLFVPREDPVKITRIRLHNHRDQTCRLALFSYARLVLGVLPGDHSAELIIEQDVATGALLAENHNGEFVGRIAFAAGAPTDTIPVHVTGDRVEFIGMHGSPAQPAALSHEVLSGRVGAALDPCFALQVTLTLEPGEVVEYAFLLGETADRDEARRLIDRYREDGAAHAALTEVQAFWRNWLDAVQIETPDPALDLMVNGWLAYQTLSCRLWGRSAFYQSGGAFGFRDQLQDAAALIYHDPQLTRRQLLLHAAHQFVEGDVLHWWHPPGGRGIRSRCSDDRLWLPYLAAFHARVTGDWSLFGEPVRFLQARQLRSGEDEAFLTPEDSGETASLYEHCCRALDRSLTQGVHGLPLMETGDWNDGMNRVGRQGRGESVWLGFFLYATLGEFIPVCGQHGDHNRTRRYAAFRRDLAEALNQHGWDGDWYRRAWDDDGAMLGSNASAECRIDALAQAWAVLAKAAPWGRAETAMDAVERHLVSEADGLIRLLTPPFVNTPQDPGYIKGYVAGVRENGGQYTHAALWVVRALAELGRRDRAAKLLEMLNPIQHALTPAAVAIYRLEPFMIAADVYGAAPHLGRGGWSGYTGAAGWMLRVALESILGLELVEDHTLRLRPCIPDDWPGFRLRYRLSDGDAVYEIAVQNPTGVAEQVIAVAIDEAPGVVKEGAACVPLFRDGRVHQVVVTLGVTDGGGGSLAEPSSPVARPLRRITLGALVRDIQTLVSLPDALLRLNALIDNPATQLTELAEAILCDPALSARLLRLINSTYYGLPNRVESIPHAINLIGQQTLRDLALASSAVNLFDGLPPEQVNMDRFWLHSIACGAAARLLARRKRLTNAERLFIAGLLHSIGKLVFYSQCPDQYRKVLGYVERGECDLLTAERRVFGFNYVELSAELLRAWRLPDYLRVAVAYQLQPTQAPEYRLEAWIVHIAARIATDLQTDITANPAAGCNPQNLAKFARLLQLPPESLATLPDEVRQSTTEIFTIVRPGATPSF